MRGVNVVGSSVEICGNSDYASNQSLSNRLSVPGASNIPYNFASPSMIQNRSARNYSRELSLLTQIRSRNILFSGVRFEVEENIFVRLFEEAVLTGDLKSCEDLLRQSSVVMLLRLSNKLTRRISEDLKYFGYCSYVRYRTAHDVAGRTSDSIHLFVCQQSWMVHLTIDICGNTVRLRTSAGLYVAQPDGKNIVLTNSQKLRLDPKAIFAHMSTIGINQAPVSLTA